MLRGLGSRKKRSVVKDLLCHETPNVVMLQETKRETCDTLGSVGKSKRRDRLFL